MMNTNLILSSAICSTAMKLITTVCAIISLLISNLCNAASTQHTVISESAEQITTGQWHIGLNAGIGVMTNPLKGGDNLPLVVIPDIAYYGEQFFFDNGRLGYSFVQSEQHVINLVAEFNPETRFFVDWHPSNIFALQSSSSLNIEAESSPVKYTRNLDDLDKRRWALDVGLSYHYLHQNHVFSLQSLVDISGVYNGSRTGLQWQMMQQYADWQIKPSLGVWYKSSELNTYFYGLSEQESHKDAIGVGSSWQPYAKIDVRYALSKANSLRFNVGYYDYSQVADSPLFKKTYSMTAFIGFDHIF